MDKNSPQSGSINGDGGDEAIAQPFDQTNGTVSGLEGDSDGTEESDTTSEALRGADRTATPVGTDPLLSKD
ncbi:hypothetical protein [Naasia lichenicola]|uniref:Uncharacterized protein n=1 Tax=Naasia lichenicola TaxID=2565933 RepID=A0A4S4FRR1_9MICO|nr:hypothetical protein [Naasia lichenicola]THG33360.1 hypothetical protein E6C64_03135 [Naasia lichenicola]